jgi:hypothetical protein
LNLLLVVDDRMAAVVDSDGPVSEALINNV